MKKLIKFLGDNGVNLLSTAIKTVSNPASVLEDVGSLIGLGTSATEDEIVSKLQTDPDSLRILKNHELQMTKLYIQAREIESTRYVEDKKNARDMYRDSGGQRQDEMSRGIMRYTGVAIPLLIIVNIAFLIASKVLEVDPAVATIVGNLIGGALQNFYKERSTNTDYYFGSSHEIVQMKEVIKNDKTRT